MPRRKAAVEVEVSALCPSCGVRFAPRPGRRCGVCIMRAVEDRTGIYREFPDDPGFGSGYEEVLDLEEAW